jgi:hypothetical protein
MAKEICQICECIFEPKSHKAMICPNCHKKRLSDCAKERNLSKIGNDARWKNKNKCGEIL